MRAGELAQKIQPGWREDGEDTDQDDQLGESEKYDRLIRLGGSTVTPGNRTRRKVSRRLRGHDLLHEEHSRMKRLNQSWCRAIYKSSRGR